jgi:hypothetical protein
MSEHGEAARLVEELGTYFYELQTAAGQFDKRVADFENFVAGLGPEDGPGSAFEEFMTFEPETDDQSK